LISLSILSGHFRIHPRTFYFEQKAHLIFHSALFFD